MMVAQQHSTVSPGSPHSNGLPQNTPSPFNLDHYKYLTSLLPSTPHPVIETVSFTDFNTWDCQIRVNLTTESDCIKWLAEFEDKTRTDWRANHEATKALPKAKGCSWQLVYRCVSSEARKECSAGIQFRIFAEESRGGKQQQQQQGGKGEPCEVKISFCHSHETQPSLLTASESYKSQDIPSHLKEGFEGYFQETMSPVQPGLTTAPSSHSASMAKCSPALPVSSSPQPVQLQLKLDQQAQASSSQLLERGFNLLRAVIQQGGTGEAAVLQFLEKLERLGEDRGQLEDALTRFGTDQWDWFMPDSTVGAVLNSASGEAQTQVILQPQSPLTNPGRLSKKHKVEEDEVVSVITEAGLPQVFGANLVGGQVLLQPTSETPEPDLKRRKRARCGTCSGCKNRDKTQDCRQCRNCLDQKRYGGPGRLKKACIKRLCVVISQMISSELAPEEKQVLHSVPVTPVKPAVKTEPQETSVTLAARSEATQQQQQPVNLAQAQTVSLVGAGGQTVSLLSSPGGHGGQTIQLNGQTYTLGTQPISLSTAPVATSSSQASACTSGTTTGGLTGSTLLSWPSSQFPSTFQVQPQQPVQFVFQPAAGFPSATAQPVQVQYTTQLGSQQLETLVSEASRQNNGIN